MKPAAVQRMAQVREPFGQLLVALGDRVAPQEIDVPLRPRQDGCRRREPRLVGVFDDSKRRPGNAVRPEVARHRYHASLQGSRVAGVQSNAVRTL